MQGPTEKPFSIFHLKQTTDPNETALIDGWLKGQSFDRARTR